MNDKNRVYFIGAGASKQDRFPLTSELKYGIGWAIREEASRFNSLTAHLRHLYNVSEAALQKSAQIWDSLKQREEDETHTEGCQIPDVTDLLSTLDWMIRDQSSFGPGLNPGDALERSSVRELSGVRDLVVQALCVSLGSDEGLEDCSTTTAFIEHLGPNDSLITTNWDLLLDAARHARFGSAPQDYGTSGNVVLEGCTDPPDKNRPELLKLHGSLSWRYCPRCQRLAIDPVRHIAGDRHEKGSKCPCTCLFSELIVTPGFIREYRNVHLLNIWGKALLNLAHASQWVFIGYSLPADDVAVRTLLLRARCLRQDVGGKDPVVTIVTGPDRRDETLARYQGILPQAKLDADDFRSYVKRGV